MDARLNDDTHLLEMKKELTKEGCQEIIHVAKSWDKAEVEGVDKIRKSKISWTNDQWLVDLVWEYMESYNEVTGLNYDLSGVEAIQITKYEKGDYYDFHIDGKGTHKNTVNGTVRKISMTIQLNDDYEGGDFQVALCKGGKVILETLEKGLGSIIVFPSILEHCVTPVTSGTRYSLVAWFIGSPFK